jgi:enterochelin esterase-like enzyme
MKEGNITVAERLFKAITTERKIIYSDFLEREVLIDVYLPAHSAGLENISLLLINDGQDLVKMNFAEILNLSVAQGIEPIICIGIHCGPDRKMEYGTGCQPDYKGRGARAGLYTKFIFDELLPELRRVYTIASFKEKSFAGFSLGGLSAIDIVWNHATEFTKTGVFSGSLWWRRKGYNDGYDDEKDRIMHLQIKKGIYRPWLKFFIQTGLLDETADRNNNGIIDSVEDAADLIAALKEKGYTDEQIVYLALEDGEHNVETWARALPEFLKWGWGL